MVEYLGLEDPGTLFEHSENRDAYPKLNAREEKKLRDEFEKLADVPPADARRKITELDKEHGCERRWARRGEAPLACALASLAIVANAKPLPTHDGSALADAYVADGAGVDWAAMCALAAAPRELDRVAATVALRAVYLPWVEESALALQELVRAGKVKLAAATTSKSKATTILFVDGLRMDLARELVRILEKDGVTIKLGWSWSGFPTVTSTCKPLVSPVASLLRGLSTTDDVRACVSRGQTRDETSAVQAYAGGRMGNG